MRIEIDVSAANDPDALRPLDRILYKIEDGWHVWNTAREPDIEALEASTWVRDQGRQGKRVREMLERSIQREAWDSAPHGRRVRVTMQPDGQGALNPENAARLSEEPLVILVENRNSDGAFVKRVVTELDKPLDKYRKKWGEPVQFDSVGGKGQMADEVERRTRERPYRPRLVVIVDSDRRGPADEVSSEARALCRKCANLGVPCWVLAKREAENYLPEILLAEWQDAGKDRARRVDAWRTLNDDQKNFFDMKNGLSTAASQIEEALFDSLSANDRAILSHGFGQNVYQCWDVWNVPSPKHELQTRGQGDLEHGLALIRGEV